MIPNRFSYTDESFADIQMLRFRLDGFEELELRQKLLVYYLSEATLCGRDITTDQFGFFNLRIRKTLESIFLHYTGNRESADFQALVVYLKRVWFSSGIYHHYGCDKFVPEFSESFFRSAVESIDKALLPLVARERVEDLLAQLCPVIFNPDILPKRVNQADGDDLVLTSACNYYEGVTQREVEDYYAAKKDPQTNEQPSWGLNSRLVKQADGSLKEEVWKESGRYGAAIRHIIYWLEKACAVAENAQQDRVINLLINYYKSGDLQVFDEYSIEWVQETESRIDFINGFIEVYGDPLGLKASWEGLVEYKDLVATRRTQTISQNAQWFEDHSPVDPRFRKPVVKGVIAHVVCAAMLGGDEYPSTAIGINLPNAEWIRARYGSKSVTIGNVTEAYNKAARGNGFRQEFVVDEPMLQLIDRYGDLCDVLHTDLHECLGHGSGQLLPNTDPDALKAYGSTIEEARADLFGLYYIADYRLVELGLLPDGEAYKSQYYMYLLNGLITQLARIKPGHQIEEAHMRNRALIARWVYDHADGAIELFTSSTGKTHLRVNDFAALRPLFARLLAEVQRIKSEGDYTAARDLVERYGVKVDAELHREVIRRYNSLHIAPYKGFINPWLKPLYDEEGEISDIAVDYTESYEHQMLRYSKEYGYL